MKEGFCRKCKPFYGNMNVEVGYASVGKRGDKKDLVLTDSNDDTYGQIEPRYWAYFLNITPSPLFVVKANPYNPTFDEIRFIERELADERAMKGWIMKSEFAPSKKQIVKGIETYGLDVSLYTTAKYETGKTEIVGFSTKYLKNRRE